MSQKIQSSTQYVPMSIKEIKNQRYFKDVDGLVEVKSVNEEYVLLYFVKRSTSQKSSILVEDLPVFQKHIRGGKYGTLTFDERCSVMLEDEII